MKIHCTNCSQRLDVPVEYCGQTLECPACCASFAVPESVSAITDKEIHIPLRNEQFTNAETLTKSSYEQHTSPVSLPSPTKEQPASFPIISVVLGCLTAVGLGITLFLASRLIYIVILYNVFIGVCLGKVISYGIGVAGYRGVFMLKLLTTVCSFLVYLAFYLVLLAYALTHIEESFNFIELPIIFVEFMQGVAGNSEFFGAEIGTIGNIIIWIVELLITCFCSWEQVSRKLRVMDVESVPIEVVEFILYLYDEKCELNTVRRELAARGWKDRLDQDKALNAASSLLSLEQDEEQAQEQDEHNSFKLTK
jgi:hypothetical protein